MTAVEPEAAPQNPSEPERGIKVVPKKWNCVAVWAWNVKVDTCAICRENIGDICIECKAEESPDKGTCPIAIGQCNHVFHYHCISRWLNSRHVCPLDNSAWETTAVHNA